MKYIDQTKSHKTQYRSQSSIGKTYCRDNLMVK